MERDNPCGQLHHRDQEFHVDFYIAILGAKTCQEINMLQRIYSLTPKPLPEVNSCMYENLFKGLGCLPGMHTIGVDKTVSPVVHPQRNQGQSQGRVGSNDRDGSYCETRRTFIQRSTRWSQSLNQMANFLLTQKT